MMKRAFLTLTLALLCSCANKSTTASSAPRATVFLRDGTSFAGVVTATSPQQITVVADDGHTTRTMEMRDVRSVEYSDQVTAPAATQTAESQDHADHYHPEASAIKTTSYGLSAGSQISVRTEETIDSEHAAEGQTYAAEVARDVLDADGQVVIPRGANAQIVIRSASRGGHIRGTSDLVMDLASVSIDGRQYELSTRDLVEKGKAGIGENRRTAKYVGGGAVVGSIIGAIAGHGKGAAIGAASGAGAGAAGQLITRGGSIRVPVESVLTFRLDQPLHVRPRY
jgi:hypothetical protein